MINKPTPERNFTIVPNEILKSNLSLEAKGFLVLILSLHPNSQFHKKRLMEKYKLKKFKMDRILREIKAAGYLKIKPKQNRNGEFVGQDWTFYNTKQTAESPITRLPDNQDHKDSKMNDAEL